MRGVVRMKVGASEHMLAPTFGAFLQIEEALGASLQQLYLAHWRGSLMLTEMAQIVAIGMNAHRADSAEPETVAKFLFEQGVGSSAVARPVAAYLAALAWTPEHAREKLAAEWGEEISDKNEAA